MFANRWSIASPLRRCCACTVRRVSSFILVSFARLIEFIVDYDSSDAWQRQHQQTSKKKKKKICDMQCGCGWWWVVRQLVSKQLTEAVDRCNSFAFEFARCRRQHIAHRIAFIVRYRSSVCARARVHANRNIASASSSSQTQWKFISRFWNWFASHSENEHFSLRSIDSHLLLQRIAVKRNNQWTNDWQHWPSWKFLRKQICRDHVEWHWFQFVRPRQRPIPSASIRQTEQKFDEKYDCEFDVTSELVRRIVMFDSQRTDERQHLFKY